MFWVGDWGGELYGGFKVLHVVCCIGCLRCFGLGL